MFSTLHFSTRLSVLSCGLSCVHSCRPRQPSALSQNPVSQCLFPLSPPHRLFFGCKWTVLPYQWGPRVGSWTTTVLQGTLKQAQAVASFGCWLGLYHLFAFFTLCHPSLPSQKTELHTVPPMTPCTVTGAQSCATEGCPSARLPTRNPTRLE